MNAEIERSHRRENALVLRHCHRKITAKTQQRFRTSIDHRLGSLYRIVPMRGRRRKAKHLFDFTQKRRRRFFGDPDGAVALYVRVPTQRANSGSRFTDIAAHQQQIGYQAHIGGAFIVLSNAHAIGDDGGVRLSVGFSYLEQIVARQTRFALN
ncbi:hypothetical protein D3C71_1197420 [compost metagenome]